MISKNIVVLLMMCLSLVSCQTAERKLICNEVTNYQVKEGEACIVSIKFNACLCSNKFDVNSWSSPVEFRVEPLTYCDGIMGLNKDFALKEIQPKFVALQRLREASCKPRTRSNKGTENLQKLLSLKILSKPTTTQEMTEEDEFSSLSSGFVNPILKDE